MKIFGFSHGSHDSSYAIYNNGSLVVHEELERLIRVKETDGDVLEHLHKDNFTFDDFNIITTYPHQDVRWYSQTFLQQFDKIKHKFIEVGHHAAHAANAYYSSGFNKAIIFTIDGGGWDRVDGRLVASSFTVWLANGSKLVPLVYDFTINLGVAWSTATSTVFKMSGGGPPYGSQAGTVMGMAAYGNPHNFAHLSKDQFLNCDFQSYSALSEQEMFDFAARMQQLTEEIVYNAMKPFIDQYDYTNMCLAGGVALNCVMTGKMKQWFNKINNIYIPPVPYDAGLAIGCAQYVYHHIQGNDIELVQNSPYLGINYTLDVINNTLDTYKEQIVVQTTCDKCVCNLLQEQNVISLFNGKSESGRRALGNRSIVADPRSNDIRQAINEKTKHRQWFRPFAPSILKDKVGEWFEDSIDSPYMSFAIPFKTDVINKVPAVVHKDGTGRLQTVNKELNPYYYDLIVEWYKQTGVPILLNTSFNDREPIVETPEDAIKCFLKTKIDYLYFVEHKLLIKKRNV